MFNWAVGREYLERTPFKRGNHALVKFEREDNRRIRRVSPTEEANGDNTTKTRAMSDREPRTVPAAQLAQRNRELEAQISRRLRRWRRRSDGPHSPRNLRPTPVPL
jgi:hypothetical protein